MNKSMAKLLASITCAAMLFSACAPSTDNGEGTVNKENKGDPVTNSTDILNEVGTYPIVKEPIVMTMFRSSQPNVVDFETNDLTVFMEEKTGITWDFETASGRDAFNEKANLLMASGDYPEVFMYYTPDPAKFGVKEQILQPIGDIMEANMPNLMAYSKENTAVMGTLTQTDGLIYTLPSINECYHCKYRNKMWVNTMWLDKIGMKMPTTTEEFKAVCKKYLEVNPDGIAVTGSIDGWGEQIYDVLINAFTYSPGSNGQLPADDKCVLTPEEKIITIANTDEYKEALIFMKELYDMGALYDGSFTQNGEQLRTLMNQPNEPVLFLSQGTISNSFNAETSPESYAHYRVNTPLEGPNGAQFATYFEHEGVSSETFAITDKCKYPEAALRWADYFYSEEGYLTNQFGANTDGKDWTLEADAKLGLDGGPATYEVINTYTGDAQNHDWQDLGIMFAPSAIRLGQATDNDVDIATAEGLEKLLFDESKNQMAPYSPTEKDNSMVPSLKFTAEESTAILTIGVEIEKHIAENMVAFITGSKDVDKDWDTYVSDFEKVGLSKYLEVLQGAYDRQFK